MSSVLFDVSCLIPEKISGIGVYTKYLYSELEKLGVDLTPVVKGSRSFGSSFVSQHIGNSPKAYWPLVSDFKYKSGTAIHGPDFKLLTGSAAYKKVVTIHDLAVFHEGFNDPVFREKGQRQLVRMLRSKDPDIVVTPTEAIRAEFIKRFPKYEARVFAVHHGGDHLAEGAIDNSEVGERPYFLYVGHFENRKNLLKIISSFEIFHEKNKDFDLYLVGKDGYGSKAIRQKIEESPAQKAIIDQGFVSTGDLRRMYSQARAFVFPSCYEGFGFPIIEAMALRCPVITSDRGAMKEVAGGSAHLVDPDSIDSILEGLKFFSTDEACRMAHILKGLERVKDFTWEKTAKKMSDLYS